MQTNAIDIFHTFILHHASYDSGCFASSRKEIEGGSMHLDNRHRVYEICRNGLIPNTVTMLLKFERCE